MVKNIFYLLIFITINVFGQNPLSTEDKIYDAVDVFSGNPTSEGLQNLTQVATDFWKNPKPKSKAELLAIVILNCNKAYYENQFGQTNLAISSYEKAWQIYQKNKVNSNELLILNLTSSNQVLVVKTQLENGNTVTNKVIY